jgi:hypothetical protein
MKIICFEKLPAKLSSKQFTNRGFPSAGDAEDDHNHGAVVCRRFLIFSMKKPQPLLWQRE